MKNPEGNGRSAPKLSTLIKLAGHRLGRVHLRIKVSVKALQNLVRSFFSARRKFGVILPSSHKVHNAFVYPFIDLLNRPSGGHAYYGGLLRDAIPPKYVRHFRELQPIDTPLAKSDLPPSVYWTHVSEQLFWCGPLCFHFGHQVAEFSSRALMSSLDPRDGSLCWLPWRSSIIWAELDGWQRSLLNYINPGSKPQLFFDTPINVQKLIVYPQQSQLRVAPSEALLDGLSVCQTRIKPTRKRTIYLSRTRCAPCKDRLTLNGSFAGEKALELLFQVHNVEIVYPELISLEEQLSLYLGSETIIVSEGSAQHGLELLGPDLNKLVVVICRRRQAPGMDLPLRSRFPRTIFIDAVESQWSAADGYSWNAIALLNWSAVAQALKNNSSVSLTPGEVKYLWDESRRHFSSLHKSIGLRRVVP